MCVCFPDGVKTGQTQCSDVSEKQLLKVAKRLGKEWKQVAIHLNLNSSQLDDIQAAEKDVTMQKLKMLVLWKSRRRQGEATVGHLWEDLKDMDDLPNDVYQTLQGKKLQMFSALKCNREDDMSEFIRAKMITKYLYLVCTHARHSVPCPSVFDPQSPVCLTSVSSTTTLLQVAEITALKVVSSQLNVACY